MKIIRVFPRKTNASPDDENVRFSEPELFDSADEVHVSVCWSWDKPRAEKLAKEWEIVAPVKIGGPAYNDPGSEFEPGMYVKKGYVFTSRGCPNHCWFCSVPKREGEIRELIIKDGFNILYSNLLACSDAHIKNVFEMLKRQNDRPRFTGGLEAKRFKRWIAEEIKILNPSSAFFAYDTQDDYEPLCNASRILKEIEEIPCSSRKYRVYVLIGFKNDTFEKAEKRLIDTIKLGFLPMAMLFNKAELRDDKKQWIKFQREWASPVIVGSKMTKIINQMIVSQREALHGDNEGVLRKENETCVKSKTCVTDLAFPSELVWGNQCVYKHLCPELKNCLNKKFCTMDLEKRKELTDDKKNQ